jgi:hypothetical protein
VPNNPERAASNATPKPQLQPPQETRALKPVSLRKTHLRGNVFPFRSAVISSWKALWSLRQRPTATASRTHPIRRPSTPKCWCSISPVLSQSLLEHRDQISRPTPAFSRPPKPRTLCKDARDLHRRHRPPSTSGKISRPINHQRMVQVGVQVGQSLRRLAILY